MDQSIQGRSIVGFGGLGGRIPIADAISGASGADPGGVVSEPPPSATAFSACMRRSLASSAAILSLVLAGRLCVFMRDNVVGRVVSVPLRGPTPVLLSEDPEGKSVDWLGCC